MKNRYDEQNNPILRRLSVVETIKLKRDSKGRIILTKGMYNVDDGADVSQYVTANSWINIKGGYGCLIKNLFCDIHPNGMTDKQKEISMYNNIIVPYIGTEGFAVDTVKYYFAKFAKGEQKLPVNPNLVYLMSFDEKKENEETIEGKDMILDENLQDTEFFSQRLVATKQYLKWRRIPEHTIINIEDELIRQEIFKKFVKYTDNHNRNWAIAVDGKNARVFPVYDFDMCCGINYISQDPFSSKCVECPIESCADNGETDLKSFIEQYKELPWMKTYIGEVLDNFNIEEIFNAIDEMNGTSIPQEIRQYYTEYFKQRLQELQHIYQEVYVTRGTKEDDAR